MRFFRDLSIRVKLFGGFGVVLVVAIVVGLVLLSKLSAVNNGGVYLGKNALPSVETVKQIGSDVTDYRRAQLAALIERSNALIAADLADAQRDTTDIAARLKSYGSMVSNATDRELWQRVQADWAAYQQATGHLNALARDPNITVGAMAKAVDGTQASFNSLQRTVSAWAAKNVQWGQQQVKSNASAYSSAKTLGISLLVAAVLVGLGIAFLISRQIRGTVVAIRERLEMMKEKGADRLSGGLTRLAEGDLTERFEITTTELTEFPGDELGDIQRTAEELRGRLVESLLSYNSAADKLQEMIGQVAETAHSVGSSSQEMAATSEEAGKANGEIAQAVGVIAQGAERQVQVVEDAKRSAAEVALAVSEAAATAQQTADVAHEARAVAQEGVGAAEKANEAMRSVRDSSQEVTGAIRELATKSEQIGQIVQTITGIAEQTNLLALNAAIEAARAGEQGRGFAVVAEEVRKLAEESQQAAEQISQLIGAIQTETGNAVMVVESGAQRTEEGAGVVEQTREAFMKIGSSVEDMTGRIEQIAAVSEQIAASAQSMQQSIDEVANVAQESSASTEEVSASTQETSASTEQIAASAQELAGNAEALNELVAQFKLPSS
jgi:methyl-accepting chemotaxis protein